MLVGRHDDDVTGFSNAELSLLAYFLYERRPSASATSVRVVTVNQEEMAYFT
jgi:hypothetical protein